MYKFAPQALFLLGLSACSGALIDGKKIAKKRGLEFCSDKAGALPIAFTLSSDCPGIPAGQQLVRGSLREWRRGDWSYQVAGLEASITAKAGSNQAIAGKAVCEYGEAKRSGVQIYVSLPREQLAGFSEDDAMKERAYLCSFTPDAFGKESRCTPVTKHALDTEWRPLGDSEDPPLSCKATLKAF